MTEEMKKISQALYDAETVIHQLNKELDQIEGDIKNIQREIDNFCEDCEYCQVDSMVYGYGNPYENQDCEPSECRRCEEYSDLLAELKDAEAEWDKKNNVLCTLYEGHQVIEQRYKELLKEGVA